MPAMAAGEERHCSVKGARAGTSLRECLPQKSERRQGCRRADSLPNLSAAAGAALTPIPAASRVCTRSAEIRCRRAADPDASPSSLVNRSTHPGRTRRSVPWGSHPAWPPIGAGGTRAQAATWARAFTPKRADSRSRFARNRARPKPARRTPRIPPGNRASRPGPKPTPRSGMSTPRSTGLLPHRLAREARAKRRAAQSR